MRDKASIERACPLAVVLGGTIPHKYLIESLQARGYRTLLIDYYDDPPAAVAADVHVKESTLDQKAVLHIARKERASLVISGCVDQANLTACYVAEKLGLPAPYSYHTALRVTDKTLMKEGMLRADIPTASYQVVHARDVEKIEEDYYPAVVKPADCNGSRGVRKIDSKDELKQALHDACKLSRTGKAIVERFNEGLEVNGYFFIADGEVCELYIKRKEPLGGDSSAALQSFVSFGPEVLAADTRENFKQVVEKIARAFSIRNAPILVQANVFGHSVKVIEFAPRVGGGLAFREIAMLTGFDMIEAVISSFLAEPVDTSRIKPSVGKVSIVHLYGSGGTLDRVEGLEHLVAEGIVEEFHLHKTPGMAMSGEDLASRNRVVGVILRAGSREELRRKIGRMISDVKIISREGQDVTRRELIEDLSL